MVAPAAALRELSRARCLELLATAGLGRVGVSLRALPVILPVRYAVIGGEGGLPHGPGQQAHRRDPPFGGGLRGRPPRSLRRLGLERPGPGGGVRVTDPAVQAAALRLLPDDLPFLHGEPARLVAVDISLVSGRSFGAVPEESGPSMR